MSGENAGVATSAGVSSNATRNAEVIELRRIS